MKEKKEKQRWSNARVIKDLQDLNAEGIAMNRTTLNAYDSRLVVAAEKRFGGVKNAVAAAGLRYEHRIAPPTHVASASPANTKSTPIRYNPFEQAFDQHRPNRGVVLNSITSPLGMSEAQRMQQGG